VRDGAPRERMHEGCYLNILVIARILLVLI
jgi:hypothetical protein